jgi:hypothetical protein
LKRWWLPLLVLVGACELKEVVTAESEDVVIAEIYLRTGDPKQLAWLHRTRSGSTTSTVQATSIQVTNPSTGGILTYVLAADSMCIANTDDASAGAPGTCYVANAAAFPITPGQRYNLRITLFGGGEMTGTTVVPSDFRILRPSASVCSLPPFTTMESTWTSSPGAWVYAAHTQINGLRDALAEQGIELEEDPLRLFGLSVSSTDTTIVFPSEFGLFDRFDEDFTAALVAIQNGLPPNTSATVSVAAADRNYVNWERGGNFNPSGLVRIGSIRGNGTGTFGSLVTKAFEIRVGDTSVPGC